ncbi:MAG: 2Fe-2S iron-sulfur cluster-binding protein [Candidatus Sumerlaeota bacterium]
MQVTIDGQTVAVSEGMSVLDAARSAGIHIPTLCYQEDLPPQSSCFLCAVRIEGFPTLQPSCAAPVRDGMVITTNSEEVTNAHRTALELLFSDHAGMCVAPCSVACPAHLDVPGFLTPMKSGDLDEATRVLRTALPLPAVLGAVCPAYCENPCVRKDVDKQSVAIRLMHRHLAEEDLKAEKFVFPPKAESTGKRVAVLGSGPTGLSAAWFLLAAGHQAVVFETEPKPGGILRDVPPTELSPEILDAEINGIRRYGAGFQCDWQPRGGILDELEKDFDLVLVTVDAESKIGRLLPEDLPDSPANLKDGKTVAVGEKAAKPQHTVRAVATARDAVAMADQFLRGEQVSKPGRPFYFKADTHEQEMERTIENAVKHDRVEPAISNHDQSDEGSGLSEKVREKRDKEGYRGLEEVNADQARQESERCLECSCDARNDCRLRDYGAQFGIKPHRFKGERRLTEQDHGHPEIVYDPGKCILCGLCLRIAEKHGERPGLSFIGRGFPTRVAVPLARGWADTLKKAARECATSCPTAALMLKDTKEEAAK